MMTPHRDEEFSIRDLCDAFDATPRALRFYESQGLISPRRVGRMRIYSARDRARLQLILRGKRFGFSLAEIGELLDLYDVGDGQVTQLELTAATAREKLEVLKAKRADLDAAIGDLEEQIALVDRLLNDRKDAPAQAALSGSR